MISDKWFVFLMAVVVVLGFAVVFASAFGRTKKFRKVFGIDPGKTEAEIKSGQDAVDAVIRGHRGLIKRIDARRPKDQPLSEAHDLWEEERALALMALDDARALARSFGYFVGAELD